MREPAPPVIEADDPASPRLAADIGKSRDSSAPLGGISSGRRPGRRAPRRALRIDLKVYSPHIALLEAGGRD